MPQMSVELKALGELISEQMTQIEGDYADREGAVGAVLSVVQVVPKEGEPELRVRSNLPPVLGSQMLKALAEQMGGD
jgi:hypothetical protein